MFFFFILHSESLYLSNPVGLEFFAFFQPRAVVEKDVVTSQGHQELEQVSDVRTDGIYKKIIKDPHIRKRCFFNNKGGLPTTALHIAPHIAIYSIFIKEAFGG